MEALTTTGLLVRAFDNAPAASWSWAGGEVVVASHRSPEKTTTNEDGALALPLSDDALLLAVADGCGGMPSGDEASRRALEALADELSNARPGDDLTGAVLAGFDAANDAVLAMRVGAGTTLAAVLVVNGSARAFHAGDSSVLITGQRGRIRLNAIPHSPTGYGLEAGLLSEREALEHEERSTVLNVVGCETMRVEVNPPVTLSPRDTVLLATDGLSDNLYLDEIVRHIRAGSLVAAFESLSRDAEARMLADDHIGHADDLTLVAYRPTLPRS